MSLPEIVLPVFLVIGLGFALRRLGVIGDDTNAALSRLVFYVAAPALLFRGTSRGLADWGARLPALLAVAGAMMLVAAASYAAGGRTSPARRGVLAQGCFRSNTIFLGLPLVLTAFGDGALAPASVLIGAMTVVENLLGVLVLTLPRAGRHALGRSLWRRVATNPLILACAAGLLASRLGVRVPGSIDRSLELVGSIAAPLGLLCAGAGLEFGRLRAEVPAAARVAFVRLVVHPALVWLALRRLGVSGAERDVPVLLMACPTAVVSYVMAREMDGDSALAAAIIVGTTVASIATLIGWLVVLRAG
jgi:predicted permease